MSKEIKTDVVVRDNSEFLHVVLGGKDYYLPFKVLAGKKVAFLDISGQVSLNESAADEIVERLIEAGVEFDTILNPVSKSNALAHAVAVRWMAKTGTDLSHTVVARKSSSPARIEATYRSVTTPKEQVLSLTDDDADFIAGKRVLVIDDVYGAGGTTKALMELVSKAGATVAAHAVIGVEEGGNFPAGLFYLFALPVGK